MFPRRAHACSCLPRRAYHGPHGHGFMFWLPPRMAEKLSSVYNFCRKAAYLQFPSPIVFAFQNLYTIGGYIVMGFSSSTNFTTACCHPPPVFQRRILYLDFDRLPTNTGTASHGRRPWFPKYHVSVCCGAVLRPRLSPANIASSRVRPGFVKGLLCVFCSMCTSYPLPSPLMATRPCARDEGPSIG